MDSFQVNTGPALSKDLVDVYWTGWIDRNAETRVRIIQNRKPDSPLPREYGENDFSVSYAGETILAKQRQFKCAWWHYHTYIIDVSKSSSGVLSAELSLVGPDSFMSSLEELRSHLGVR